MATFQAQLNGGTISLLAAEELPVLHRWAADEGWNPGRGDLTAIWHLQPQAFLGLRVEGDLVGAGTILDHGGGFGFMGLFILAPSHRGIGLGREFWHLRRNLLLERLGPGALIGMDGVLGMEPFYQRGGFDHAYRDVRMTGVPMKW